MEPLTTTCTTCGRRLRVRSADLIGQIVSCPKCGGMVQIAGPPENADASQLPQQIAVGPSGEVDSQAITRDSIDGELHRATLADPVDTSAGAVFNDSNIDGADDPEPTAPLHQGPAGTLPVGWQSDRARRARQIGLIATLSITGIAAAAAAFLFFVQRWQENQSQLAKSPPTVVKSAEDLAPVSATPPSGSTDAVAQDVPTDEPPAPAPDTSPAEPAASPAEDAEQPADALGAGGNESSNGPAEEIDGPEQRLSDQKESSATVIDAAPGAANPADLMPESVLGPRPDKDEPTGEEAAKPSPQLPPGLQKYTSLLGLGNDDGAEEQLEEPVTPDQVKLDQPADEEATAFGPAEPISISNRLKFEVAFDKKNAPLTQWLRILSQITGVPISLDVASLDAAGIAPTQAAEPVSGWTTAEAVLDAVAESAGCTVRKTDALVIVEANAEAVAAGIEPALQVDDLIAAENAEQRESLSQLIGRVTRAESVTIDPVTGRVVVEGDSSTAWLTALMLDGLRIARQLPPRLPRDRTQRWLAIDQSFDWPEVQGGKGIEPLDHPQSLISLVDRVAAANDAAVVFAWSDLWQHGLTPESTAMPWTENVSGGDLLERMLAPYQLQVRQTSDDLWWVGSQTLYDRDPAMGLIRVSDSSGDAVIERLARSLGEPSGENLSVGFDESSGYLVAMLPRFLLRQLPELVSADQRQASKTP